LVVDGVAVWCGVLLRVRCCCCCCCVEREVRDAVDVVVGVRDVGVDVRDDDDDDGFEAGELDVRDCTARVVGVDDKELGARRVVLLVVVLVVEDECNEGDAVLDRRELLPPVGVVLVDDLRVDVEGIVDIDVRGLVGVVVVEALLVRGFDDDADEPCVERVCSSDEISLSNAAIREVLTCCCSSCLALLIDEFGVDDMMLMRRSKPTDLQKPYRTATANTNKRYCHYQQARGTVRWCRVLLVVGCWLLAVGC
jgi:hypothetical protein